MGFATGSSSFATEKKNLDTPAKHLGSQKHKTCYEAVKSSGRVTNHFGGDQSLGNQVIKAETQFVGFLVEHNLPLSVASHAMRLFKQMFLDSKIAAKYQCGRTKATHILNGAIAKDSVVKRTIQVCM